MAQPIVTVNSLNLSQGPFPEIERKALFIGIGATNLNSILSLNPQSDLDVMLGVADSAIKTQAQAAKDNGGENWFAWCMPIDGLSPWQISLDAAMAVVSPELVILCTPAINAVALNDMQTKAESIRTTMGRRIIIITATPEIDSGNKTWAEYATDQAAITNGVAAPRVVCVPLLHGNDLGVLAGRLCNRSVSVADSPMRTATGSLSGLGPIPVDSAGVSLPSASVTALDTARLSCSYIHTDYPGTYWGDANCLDVPAGDFQVIENMRVVDKAARAIRILSIAKVGDRSFNSTPASIESAKTYFMRPLREMSKGTEFSGTQFPGDIKTPKDDSITIQWLTKIKVQIFFKVTPFNSPKEIVANIILDLSTSEAV
ncbi:MAG: DUF2586 family protein [Gammaproteobacteria bacterium]|nr:DUF2586 family protein [Gammaproteobacteria bacterium]